MHHLSKGIWNHSIGITMLKELARGKFVKIGHDHKTSLKIAKTAQPLFSLFFQVNGQTLEIVRAGTNLGNS